MVAASPGGEAVAIKFHCGAPR